MRGAQGAVEWADQSISSIRGSSAATGAADREAEVARHVGLGATRLEDGRGWTVMRDPVGVVYCVTGRHPDRARQT